MDVAGVTPFGLQERQYFGISTHTAASMFGEWNSNFLNSFNNPFTQSLDSGSPSVIAHVPDQTYTTSFTFFNDAFQGRLTITGTGTYLRNWQTPADYYTGDELTHFETVLPLLPAEWVGVAHEQQTWVVEDGPQAGVTGVTTTTFYTMDWQALPDEETPIALGPPWIISGYAAGTGPADFGAQLGSPYAPAIAGTALLTGGAEAAAGFIALGGSGAGTLTVQGADTVLHSGPDGGNVIASGIADGALNVLDGARVESSLLARLGQGALHTVIDGADSVLSLTASPAGSGLVGIIDQGFLAMVAENTTTIRNGGLLDIAAQGEQSAVLALLTSHAMTVDGVGSSAYVHSSPTATDPALLTIISVEQGASLSVSGGAVVYVDEQASGLGGVFLGGLLPPDAFSTAPATVVVDGTDSRLYGGETIVIGEHFDFDPVFGYTPSGNAGGASILTVRNGGSVGAHSIRVGPAGTLNGNGGTLGGNVENHGLIDVGESIGEMTIFGDFTQASDGTLLIEIGGTTRGSEYDALNVVGAVHLGGTLKIVLVDGYLPGINDRFNFLYGISIDGAFDHVIAPVFGNGQQFALHFDANGITVSVSAVPLPGAAWLLVAGCAALARRRKPAQSRSIDSISDGG